MTITIISDNHNIDNNNNNKVGNHWHLYYGYIAVAIYCRPGINTNSRMAQAESKIPRGRVCEMSVSTEFSEKFIITWPN